MNQIVCILINEKKVDIPMLIKKQRTSVICDVSQPENDYLYRQFSNALEDSFLTFIVAHECVYYYLGHLGKSIMICSFPFCRSALLQLQRM